MQTPTPITPSHQLCKFLKQTLIAAGIIVAGFAPAAFAQAQAPAAPAANSDFYQFVNATGGAFTDAQISYCLDNVWHTLAEAKSAPIVMKSSQRIKFKMQNDKGVWEDFIEYTQNANWNGNTTYVDGFVFPITIELTKKDGGTVKLGVNESRSALFELFEKDAPPEFKGCVDGDKQILSPYRVQVNGERPMEHYFDKYVDEIWNMYAVPKTLPSGWTGKVEDGKLIFSKPGEKDRVCESKPTSKNILLGDGVLGRNAAFCGAFNRHVAADPGDWKNPATYYKQLPYNFYAKFCHDHAIDAKAYGFAYDDAEGQASYVSAPASKLVVTFYWDAVPPAVKPKTP